MKQLSNYYIVRLELEFINLHIYYLGEISSRSYISPAGPSESEGLGVSNVKLISIRCAAAEMLPTLSAARRGDCNYGHG